MNDVGWMIGEPLSVEQLRWVAWARRRLEAFQSVALFGTVDEVRRVAHGATPSGEPRES